MKRGKIVCGAVLVLAFDCGGRRGDMGGQVDKELQVMRKAVGNTPLFGFYGSGETGPKDNNSPPRGVGHHIIICAILSPQPTIPTAAGRGRWCAGVCPHWPVFMLQRHVPRHLAKCRFVARPHLGVV